MKPRLLDLFCGAGGCAVGYARAGFEVVGVDVEPQPNYPFEFVQYDALDYLDQNGEWVALGFSAVHASPPCQRWTSRSNGDHPDLIGAVRDRLRAIGPPFVIENVPAAPLRSPVVLCGSSFGLRVRRHRAFEASFGIMAPPCSHATQPEIVTVTGGGPSPASFHRPAGGGPDRKPKNVADAADAMGIDWPMTRAELNEAIPPAYTEHIGAYLLRALRVPA